MTWRSGLMGRGRGFRVLHCGLPRSDAWWKARMIHPVLSLSVWIDVVVVVRWKVHVGSRSCDEVLRRRFASSNHTLLKMSPVLGE